MTRTPTTQIDVCHAKEAGPGVLLPRLRQAPPGQGRLPEPPQPPRRIPGGRRADAVAGLLAEPGRVRAGFDARIDRERALGRGDPGGEADAWLGRLADADRARGAYQEMTARGLMTLGELGARLEGLEETRRTALRELEALRARGEDVGALRRDRDALLELFAGGRGRAGALAVLEGLGPEERKRLYRTLELEVRLDADGGMTVGGIPGEVSFGDDG